MKFNIKSFILIMSGQLTLIMLPFVPYDGQVGMMFYITIPFFLILGIIFTLFYSYSETKIKKKNRDVVFYLMLLILIGLSLWLYPYNN